MNTKRQDKTTMPQHKELEKQPTSLNPCCLRKDEIIDKYGRTAKEFLLTVTPSQQSELYKDIPNCYFGEYPTLMELNKYYTAKTAQAWLIPQLLDLSEYCGVKEKFTTNQLNQCSDIIAKDYAYLKVSEIMLFFARFKRCYYGRLYGSVDPLVIIEALKKFCHERIMAYYEKNNMEEEKKVTEGLKGACSWDEFVKMKKQMHSNLNMQKSNLENLKGIVTTKTTIQTKKSFEEKIPDIAKDIVENTYNLDEYTLNQFRGFFEDKFGCKPEEYAKYKS